MTDKLVVYDCEIAPNYFLCAMRRRSTGQDIRFELIGRGAIADLADRDRLKKIMLNFETFGFNNLNFDNPLIAAYIAGWSPEKMMTIVERIIHDRLPGWMVYGEFNLKQPSWPKTFDIIEPAPAVRIGLKLYAARMHIKTMADLPFTPGAELLATEIENTRVYCGHDLTATQTLYDQIEPSIVLRRQMSDQYGLNLRSKSDAQIAEAVIKHEINRRYPDTSVFKPEVKDGTTFRYTAPDWVSFKSGHLTGLLEFVQSHKFELDGKGSPKLPPELSEPFVIGSSTYKFGIGGLHSQEKNRVTLAGSGYRVLDVDVTAFYPSIISELGLSPKHLGEPFLEVYRELIASRVAAKRRGDKVADATGKIVINGSFGKLGSKYSILYSPDLMLAVTLTGQLALLMLIEALVENGIDCVSANTDGVVSRIADEDLGLFRAICFDWELTTGFNLEEAEYSGLYSKDVNNYCAIKTDGEVKTKGQFSPASLRKNPVGDVIYKAVIDHLQHATPLDDFIRGHSDLRDFIVVRSVSGGGLWRNQYLGRVARWVYTTDGEPIVYKVNGNKVATSDGAHPIIDLDDLQTVSLDYAKYIAAAKKIVKNLGVYNDSI